MYRMIHEHIRYATNEFVDNCPIGQFFIEMGGRDSQNGNYDDDYLMTYCWVWVPSEEYPWVNPNINSQQRKEDIPKFKLLEGDNSCFKKTMAFYNPKNWSNRINNLTQEKIRKLEAIFKIRLIWENIHPKFCDEVLETIKFSRLDTQKELEYNLMKESIGISLPGDIIQSRQIWHFGEGGSQLIPKLLEQI